LKRKKKRAIREKTKEKRMPEKVVERGKRQNQKGMDGLE